MKKQSHYMDASRPMNRYTGRTLQRNYTMGAKYNRKAGMFHHTNWKPVRFVQLFIFLVLVILLAPFLNKAPLLSALLAILFLNILIVCLSYVGFNVRRRWPLILLWLSGPLLEWAASQAVNSTAATPLFFSADIARAVLLVACVTLILRYVIKSNEVTIDTIFGALVAYFMIAFAFSCLYQAVAVLEPASFSISGMTVEGHSVSLKTKLNYFSFVTIATVGYGDIVPTLPASQALAILEAIIGQFYLAGLIAWLVSVYAHHGKKAKESPAAGAQAMECKGENTSKSVGAKLAGDEENRP